MYIFYDNTDNNKDCYIGTCPECESKIGFTEGDTTKINKKTYENDQYPYYTTAKTIVCPCCFKEINISIHSDSFKEITRKEYISEINKHRKENNSIIINGYESTEDDIIICTNKGNIIFNKKDLIDIDKGLIYKGEE